MAESYEPNDLLRAARERVESPYSSGDFLSRRELAESVNAWVFEHTPNHRVVELDGNYIAKLERGVIRWPQDPDRRAGFRAVLGVATDAELGFRRPQRTATTLVAVERQRFIRLGLGAGGCAAVAGPSALVALLPGQPKHVPSVVGMPHVAEVRAVTEEFRSWDARYGGGMMRPAVTAQLHHYAELLDARCSAAVRRELLTAVGDFAEVAGYVALDDDAYDDARRLFGFALSCAEEIENWQLRANVLCSMSFHDSCCGNPDAGLTWTESALIRAERLTAAERARLYVRQAHDLTKLGRVQDALRAIGTADEEFSRTHPGEDLPWMASYTEARHLGSSGNVLWEIGVRGRFVAEAHTRLAAGVANRAEGRAQARGQIKIASLTMATGDPVEAASTATQVLDSARLLRSRRATDDLRELRRLAQPHTHLPEVADLYHRLGTAIAT